ncbi:MAG: integration host factor, actinobacterial type [Tractidigestivibacter sp.]|uniref:integration host factor, actinobacterial type n=1 Tax=Tractidigestivibacter sp. TaxID=2847320 RepID=UPI002A7F09A5|nr:integration host factor, actinobacterial type [Tractidigestivibacter sp.]MCI6273926.1 integration host factor [Coriobacteriaceae bacterium]MDY4534185.1 integration host factor, actinobacterial type [Tractidigestivibacter sp.]
MAIPELTDEQRRENLRRAAAARREKAGLLHALKDGEAALAEVLDDPRAERIRVEALIRALPGYGRARSEGLMAKLGIARSRRVRGLGVRQRRALLEAVGDGK